MDDRIDEERPESVPELLDLLELEPLDRNLYRRSQPTRTVWSWLSPLRRPGRSAGPPRGVANSTEGTNASLDARVLPAFWPQRYSDDPPRGCRPRTGGLSRLGESLRFRMEKSSSPSRLPSSRCTTDRSFSHTNCPTGHRPRISPSLPRPDLAIRGCSTCDQFQNSRSRGSGVYWTLFGPGLVIRCLMTRSCMPVCSRIFPISVQACQN